uniref:Uncharacterized protein n=1 Tax=Panagrolaimus superbus TaxID=310955 RepID=A0A914YIP6_9BILA
MENFPTLEDVLSSEDDSCKDDRDNIITKREDVIKNIMDRLPNACRCENVMVLLMKIAKRVFPSKSSSYKQLSFQDQEFDVNYHRMVHCEFLAQGLQNSIGCLGEKLLQSPLDDPHFGIHQTKLYCSKSLQVFLKFIMYNYASVKSEWSDYIDTFLNCSDVDIWYKRMEDFRSYCYMEYDFCRKKENAGGYKTFEANRNVSQLRFMLKMFNLIPADTAASTRLQVKASRCFKAKDTFSYPLLDYDINNLLDKLMENAYDQNLLSPYLRHSGSILQRSDKEENVNYLTLADLLKCLKLKLALKTGLRLGSINSSTCPEKSLKVNDVKITMLGQKSFQLQILVQQFKTGDRPLRYDIYPNGDDTFDCNILMVIYLAVRGLFVHPLSVCIQNQNFEIKVTEELLFPNLDQWSYLLPSKLCATRTSHQLVTWLQKVTSLPLSFIDHTATRKGYFIKLFANAIQASPYSSKRKIFNYIASRTGWSTGACFRYDPSMDVDSLKELYIHRVHEAKEAGCPKPHPIDLVISATTAAHPLQRI